MDFITKFPQTTRGEDSIWVILDQLTKSSHFIPIQESISMEKLVDIYIREVVKRHGAPVSVISERDVCFNSGFWRKYHEELGT